MAKVAKYEWQIYKDTLGFYRWRFLNLNNKKIMANGSEGYDKKYNCKRSLLNVARVFGPTAPIIDKETGKEITKTARLF